MEIEAIVETAEVSGNRGIRGNRGNHAGVPDSVPDWGGGKTLQGLTPGGTGGGLVFARARAHSATRSLHWFEESARIIKKPPETTRTGGVARKTFFNLVAPPTREHQETPGNNPDWGSGPKNLF